MKNYVLLTEEFSTFIEMSFNVHGSSVTFQIIMTSSVYPYYPRILRWSLTFIRYGSDICICKVK